MVAIAAPTQGHNAINGELLLLLISLYLTFRHALNSVFLFYINQVYVVGGLLRDRMATYIQGRQTPNQDLRRPGSRKRSSCQSRLGWQSRNRVSMSGPAYKHSPSANSGSTGPETRGTYIFQYITKPYSYGEILLLPTISLQSKLFPIRGKYFLFYAKIPSRVFCQLSMEEMQQYFAKTSSLLETNCMGIRFLLIHLPYIITAVISTNLINYTLISQLWCI